MLEAAAAFMDGLPDLLVRAWAAEVALVIAVTLLSVMLVSGGRGGARVGGAKILIWPLLIFGVGVAVAALNPFHPPRRPLDPDAAAFADAPQARQAPAHVRHARAKPARPFCFRVPTDPSQSNC